MKQYTETYIHEGVHRDLYRWNSTLRPTYMKVYTETYIDETVHWDLHIWKSKYIHKKKPEAPNEKICIYINRDLRPAYMKKDVYA